MRLLHVLAMAVGTAAAATEGLLELTEDTLLAALDKHKLMLLAVGVEGEALRPRLLGVHRPHHQQPPLLLPLLLVRVVPQDRVADAGEEEAVAVDCSPDPTFGLGQGRGCDPRPCSWQQQLHGV